MIDSNGRIGYSRDEFRRMSGFGFNKIDELIRTRKLHAIKVGRRVLIPADAVRRFLDGDRGGSAA